MTIALAFAERLWNSYDQNEIDSDELGTEIDNYNKFNTGGLTIDPKFSSSGKIIITIIDKSCGEKPCQSESIKLEEIDKPEN